MDIQFKQTEDGMERIPISTIVGFCHDCEEHYNDLRHYRYEPSTLLCEGCEEERMKED